MLLLDLWNKTTPFYAGEKTILMVPLNGGDAATWQPSNRLPKLKGAHQMEALVFQAADDGVAPQLSSTERVEAQ